MAILESLSNQEDIKNIYIYVGDAVRYDYLSDSVANMGLDIKAIAGGIHSPTSFATLVSGMYYPQHGVANFTNPLSTEANILHSSSHETAFCNTINHPPFNTNPATESIITETLETTDSNSDVLEEIQTPFVVMERGPGGHAPYGDFEGDAIEYFQDRINSPPETFAQEYAKAVQRDGDWFRSQVASLKTRDLLDETLIIYTSDHGELLGEMSMLGHNAPIHRRLVETPCVFIHPTLSNHTVRNESIRHIDLLPTVAEIADISFPKKESLLGTNLVSDLQTSVGASYYNKQLFSNKSYLPTLSFAYESVWDATGGYVFPRSNFFTRAAGGVRSLIVGSRSQFHRRHAIDHLTSFLEGTGISGTPQFSQSDGEQYLSRIRTHEPELKNEEPIKVQKERLHELGYLE